VKLSKSKEEIMAKADELGAVHEAAYKGCAESTFLAIVDALRWGGAEIITPEVEDTLFPGVSLLSAGVGITGRGTCGAAVASLMAIGMALAAIRDAAPRDLTHFMDDVELVRREILDYFTDKYGSYRCLDVQMKRFGKAWDFREPAMSEEFLGITDGCAIRDTARRAAGIICDQIERS